MKFFPVRWAALAAALLLFCSGCRWAMSTVELAPVKNFDVDRYTGLWYEVARLPHSFERDMQCVTARYRKLADGTIEVTNTGWKEGVEKSVKGVARFKGASDIGLLKVSFFRPFWGEYRIIHLAPDYSAAIVTGSTYDYLWFLSRTPELPPGRLLEYVNYVQALGFQADQLIFPLPALKPPPEK